MKNQEKYIIMRDRQMLISPAYWNNLVTTGLAIKKNYGRRLKCVWSRYYQINNQAYILSFYDRRDFLGMGNYVAKRLFRETGYFERIEKGVEKKKKEIYAFFPLLQKINLSQASFSELLKTAKKIQQLWIGYDTWNVPAWYMAGDQFKNLLEKNLNLPEEDFLFLTTPQ